MTRFPACDRIGVLILTFLCLLPAISQAAQTSEPPTPVGGLLVHMGCGGGERLIAFAAQGSWLLHGLEIDDTKVARAQALIRSKGLDGIATAEHWDGSKLPYADNLVNLIIGDDVGRVNKTEILRVLAPGGVARLKGETIVKPWPKEMDGWTHPRHGPDGNPVSRDTMVGVPREIRWILGTPLSNHLRPLTADGKYYLGRETYDAFNGLPLWRGNVMPQAAGDGHVYGFAGANVVALDAATGARTGEFGSADAKEATLLYTTGRLLIATSGSLRLCDAKTTKPLWSLPLQNPRYAVIGGERVFALDGKAKQGDNAMLCLEISSGKEVWRIASSQLGWLKDVTGLSFGANVLTFEVSPYADGADCTLHVISASDGKYLWSTTYKPPMGHRFQARALFLEDDLWIHQNGFTLLDHLTGKKERSVKGGGGHCFPAIATVRYLIHGELNMTDAKTGKMEANRITKGSCTNDPYIPGNGLLYSIPKNCICFPMIEGHTALAPGDETAAPKPPAKATWAPGGIEKGPVANVSWPEPSSETAENEWPMYRHDRFRTGGTSGTGPTGLAELWSQSVAQDQKGTSGSKKSLSTSISVRDEWDEHPFVPAQITAPVVAGGRVFIAEAYAQKVTALNAATGKPLWQFSANGIIDTPPTIDRGRCLFGTRAGWVYCLSAESGEMIWRVRPTPEDRRIVAWGSLESAWPVSGTILVDKGIAYVAAGRSVLADGGVHVTCIQIDNGNIVQHHVLDSFGIDQWYARLAHDFDPVDILAFDGDEQLVMSRTRLMADKVTPKPNADGAFYRPGKVEAFVPVGMWSYGMSLRRKRERRPLYVFQGDTLYGGESPTAYTPPTTSPTGGGREWNAFQVLGGFKKKWSGPASKIVALAATDKGLYIADGSNEFSVLSATDGKKIGSLRLPAPAVWDGMAIAYGRLYVSLENGNVVSLGAPGGNVPSPQTGTSVARPKSERPAPAASSSAQTAAAAEPTQAASFDEAALKPFIETLRERIRKTTAQGIHPFAYLALTSDKPAKVKIVAADEKTLTVEMKGGKMPLPWKQFDLRAHAALAQAFAGEKDAEGHLLVGILLMATGRGEDGDRELAQAVMLDPTIEKRVKEARAMGK